MARFCLIVAAIVCFITNSVEAQQTNNEKVRAPLEQPLVAPKPLLFWVERMSHTDPELRKEAIEFLGHEVEQTGLFDLMFYEVSVERQSAFRSQARSVLPVLLQQFRNGGFPLDNWEEADSSFLTVIMILMAMGADAEAAIPDVKAIAADERNPFGARMQSVMALLHIVPEEQSVGPLFLDVLNSIPPELQKETDESYKTLQDEELLDLSSIGIMSTYYSMSLIHTGHTKSEVPTLVKVASGNYPVVYRAIAIDVLAELSFDARAAMPDLRKLLKDADPMIRELAVRAILMIEDDETLIPELLPLLELEVNERKEYEQSLLECFADQKTMREKYAEMSLGDELGQYFLQSILEFLKHRSGFRRRQTIQMLGYIGSNAKAALPELRKALDDPDEDTRRMAAEAIRKIENK